VLGALLDIFLTVLYARSGAGFLSHRLSGWVWAAFRGLAGTFPRARAAILSFGGPTLLVVLAGTWLLTLVTGFALISWPAWEATASYTQQDAPTGRWTAFYFAGSTLSTAGVSDLRPTTRFLRTMVVVNSLVGLTAITLTITYFIEVYAALLRRNAFALRVHYATAGTGDAAELLAGLGAGGDFSEARSELAKLADGLADLYESQHFYEALLYFRFREPHYAMARVVTVVMDAATLVETALDGGTYGGVQGCAAMKQLRGAGGQLLDEVSKVFLPSAPWAGGGPPDEAAEARWRKRYGDAARRLREAGIRTTPDERTGAEAYVARRRGWDRYVRALGDYMEQDREVVDPASHGKVTGVAGVATNPF
jgi:hypothetical protein